MRKGLRLFIQKPFQPCWETVSQASPYIMHQPVFSRLGGFAHQVVRN